MLKTKKYILLVSKHNSNHERQVTLSMISNGEKQWHYPAVKNYQHYEEELHQKIMVSFIV